MQGNRLQDLVVELQMALKPSAVTQQARPVPVVHCTRARIIPAHLNAAHTFVLSRTAAGCTMLQQVH